MKPYEELPAMYTANGFPDGPAHLGTGVYRTFMEGMTKEEFDNYLVTLENHGFTPSNRIHSDEKRIWTTTFQKGNVFTTLYYRTKKTAITLWYDDHAPKYSGIDIFKHVPLFDISDSTCGEPVDYGAGNFVVTVENTDKTDYEAYLVTLESNGFTKYVDNSEGLYEAVWTSTYMKENLALTITYVKYLHKTYVSACYDLPLSKHLFYDEKDVSNNTKNAQTELHIPEMWKFGNSFIFKLKNGHFVVSDGGFMCEAGYFLDYLETLVPEGEKPIIEGWFISHAHPDHSGVVRTLWLTPEYADRIFVEGFYYNEPSNAVFAFDQGGRVQVNSLKNATQTLRTTQGTHPKIYRTQTGQRYYFNDIIVDIILGQEQHCCQNYSPRDFNDSSTWCMFVIEGQKCLFGGDGGNGATAVIMSMYDSKHFDLDLFTTLHHGLNTFNDFTDFCKIKTTLFTRASDPRVQIEENQHLKDVSEEWFSRAEGPRVLTFPYRVGTSKILPHFEWIYNVGEEKPFS